jgi:Tfp pilus assembly protein PilN
MIRVNLLPPELAVVERKVNPNHVVAGVALVLAAVIVPHGLIQSSRRSRLTEEADSLRGELERYKPIVQQVEELEKAKGELQSRKSVIQALETERLRYPYFMEDFLKLMPNNVWITNMSTTLPPDGSSINVSMDVLALDHYAVADMVSNLETSQIFSDIVVGSIVSAQATTGGQSITFRITSTYRKAALNATAPKG